MRDHHVGSRITASQAVAMFESKMVAAVAVDVFVLVVLVYFAAKDWCRYWPNLAGFMLTTLMVLAAWGLHPKTRRNHSGWFRHAFVDWFAERQHRSLSWKTGLGADWT